MGTKGNGISVNHHRASRSLECAGRAQRRRRFSPPQQCTTPPIVVSLQVIELVKAHAVSETFEMVSDIPAQNNPV
jgi:hypothetical protein